MLYVNLGLASLTLMAWLVVRVVHGMRPRWLASVMPGIRWKFFFACVGLAVVAMGLSLVVGAFLPGDANGTTGTAHVPDRPAARDRHRHLVHHAAAGARGGVRLPRLPDAGLRLLHRLPGGRAAAHLGPLRAAHGTQNFPLFFDRFAFGLMAGLLVILRRRPRGRHRAARAEQPASPSASPSRSTSSTAP